MPGVADVCTCPCHQDPQVRHIMPCCRECSKCKKNIELVKANEHEEHCAVEQKS